VEKQPHHILLPKELSDKLQRINIENRINKREPKTMSSIIEKALELWIKKWEKKYGKVE
jgi:hypothetical protein